MPTEAAGKAEKLIRKAIRERESRRSGRSRVVGVVVLLALVVFGLVMIIGVFPAHPNDTSAPTCDGATMSPQDVCDEFVNGIMSGSSTYQDMVHQQQESHPAALVVGIVALGIAALAVRPVVRWLDPNLPWGEARPELCPQCHEPNLREKEMTRTERRGRVNTTWRGVVILCTPGCGFSTIRKA